MLTVSFKALPALNTGALEAGIFISALVWGFLPFLAALCLTSKVPNPTNWTFSPFLRAPSTDDTKASKAASAAFLLICFLQQFLQ